MAAGDIIVISESADGQRGNYFDGVDDYVLHDAHAVARVAAGDTVGTYTAWIWLDDIASGALQMILSAGDNNSATEYFAIYINTTGELKTVLKHGGVDQFLITETTASLKSKTWCHVAVVQTGVRPILYVNGKAVAMTDSVSLDLTDWYAKLTLCDKFAIGVLETNATHTNDFDGAIGQVKYWTQPLSAEEILNEFNGDTTSSDSSRQTVLAAALQFNVTMENDGITDSGLGADNGTLTGNAHYGAMISDHSWAVEANSTGHAAEFINTFIDGSKYVSIIKRGD